MKYIIDTQDKNDEMKQATAESQEEIKKVTEPAKDATYEAGQKDVE